METYAAKGCPGRFAAVPDIEKGCTRIGLT
jgi:hypothetical protein